jgi:hypothetical protein
MTLRGPNLKENLSLLHRMKGQGFDRCWARGDRLSMVALPATSMFLASRKDMTALYERFMDRLARELDTPVWERSQPPPEAILPATDRGALAANRFCLVTMLCRDAIGINHIAEFHRGTRDGARIGIGLELYRRTHGNWPASLDKLVPRWLSVLPADRITGEPLRMAIVDDRPIVYSLGPDRDDDGGRAIVNVSVNYDVGHTTARLYFGETAGNCAPDGDWVVWSAPPFGR